MANKQEIRDCCRCSRREGRGFPVRSLCACIVTGTSEGDIGWSPYRSDHCHCIRRIVDRDAGSPHAEWIVNFKRVNLQNVMRPHPPPFTARHRAVTADRPMKREPAVEGIGVTEGRDTAATTEFYVLGDKTRYGAPIPIVISRQRRGCP